MSSTDAMTPDECAADNAARRSAMHARLAAMRDAMYAEAAMYDAMVATYSGQARDYEAAARCNREQAADVTRMMAEVA